MHRVCAVSDAHGEDQKRTIRHLSEDLREAEREKYFKNCWLQYSKEFIYVFGGTAQLSAMLPQLLTAESTLV